MVVGQQRGHVVFEQRMMFDAFPPLRCGDNHQIGAVFIEQADGIGMKARDDVHFHVRPAFAQGIQRGHQPVEARVALDRDPQGAGDALADTGEVAFRIASLALHVIGQHQQSFTGAGPAQRAGLPLEEFEAVVLFQRTHLMRQRALAKANLLAGPGEVAGLGEGDQGIEVADLKHGGSMTALIMHSMANHDEEHSFGS